MELKYDELVSIIAFYSNSRHYNEDYMIVNDQKYWFDDRVESRDALKKIVRVQESGVDTGNLPWGRSDRVGNTFGNLLG